MPLFASAEGKAGKKYGKSGDRPREVGSSLRGLRRCPFLFLGVLFAEGGRIFLFKLKI